MANRFWVSGAGTWDSTTTTHWSTTSGGAGGASVPGTSTDNVFFDANSGSGTVTCNYSPLIADLITLNTSISSLILNSGINVGGNITLGGTISGSVGMTAFANSSPIITSNGFTLPLLTLGNVNGAGTGNYTFADNLNASNLQLSNSLNTGTVTITANGNVSVPIVVRTNSGSPSVVINMGSGVWKLSSPGTVWAMRTATNLTINASTSTIKITDASTSAIIFDGVGMTYNNIWSARGASTGSLTISGSNTFSNFKDDGTGTHSILFTDGTTQTVTTFTVSGTAGHLISITGTSTGTHTLSCARGAILSDYLNIQHSVATGGAIWTAGINSINNQSVATAGSGWIFTDSNPNINFLVVAGGATGTGSATGPGGSGGQVFPFTKKIVSGTPYTITVGASDTDSSAFGYTAKAGSITMSGSGKLPGASNTNSGGGGASDSANGNDATSDHGGIGGLGTSNSISGTSVVYGSGGGGPGDLTGGIGGTNGGHGGDQVPNTPPTPGTANTGSGGGGAYSGIGGIQAGGSGIVIISAIAGTINPSLTTGGTYSSSGGNDIWTFTSSGTFTPTLVSGGSFFLVM